VEGPALRSLGNLPRRERCQIRRSRQAPDDVNRPPGPT
jgi:hypothetical protein